MSYDYIVKPLEDSEVHRCGELVLAYLAGDEDRYDDLMAHTIAEFDSDRIMLGLIHLMAGTVKGIADERGMSTLASTMNELLNEPVGDCWP